MDVVGVVWRVVPRTAGIVAASSALVEGTPEGGLVFCHLVILLLFLSFPLSLSFSSASLLDSWSINSTLDLERGKAFKKMAIIWREKRRLLCLRPGGGWVVHACSLACFLASTERSSKQASAREI